VAWAGHALGWGRGRFARGSPSRLLAAGALVTLGVTSVAAAAAVSLVALASTLGWLGLVIEALALKSTFSLRGLARRALIVGDDLGRADLGAARAAVGRDLVSRPTGTLDAGGVASAAIESVAENLTDAFLAPLLFFALFGLPGAVAYRVINTADAMIGYREGVLLHFGRVAARLDDALNLVPARLAALLIVIAAPMAGADGRHALAAMRGQHGRTASPNAGWTMAAMAGALGVTLEKPAAYRLGDGAPPASADIPRAVRVLAVAAALAIPPLVALSLRLG
jgi:adenosylcobinamide-phosphate synthase